ncbi:MAG TPA: hypothetical protein V6D08_19330 [Candidatus Obscuribacterales bacterium]
MPAACRNRCPCLSRERLGTPLKDLQIGIIDKDTASLFAGYLTDNP